MYNCKVCDYDTNDKSNYNKHLLSKKHLLKSGNDTPEKGTKKPIIKESEKPAITKLYKCDHKKCDYETSNKSNYNRHIKIHDGTIEDIYKYKCKACDEKIKDTHNLCAHFRTQNHVEKVRENFPETVKPKSGPVGPRMGLDLSKRNVYIKDLKDKEHKITATICHTKDKPEEKPDKDNKEKKVKVASKKKSKKDDSDDEDDKPKHINIKDYFKYEYYELDAKEIKAKVNEMYNWLKKFDSPEIDLIEGEFTGLKDEIDKKDYDAAYLNIYNFFTDDDIKSLIKQYKLNAS